MDATKIILGAISIVIGLVLLPLVAVFVRQAKTNTSVQLISGLGSILDIIVYSFCFGLIGVGVGMISYGFKGTD